MSAAKLLLVCLLLSCNRNGRQSADCPPDVMCTMEFRTISITVTTGDGQPVSLDRYTTVRVSDQHIFDLQQPAGGFEDSMHRATGVYPVVSDGQQKQLSTKGTVLEFRGERNGRIIVREQFQVKDNCCHVELMSGNTRVTATY